ncbi:phosphoglycolate phosphatase [Malonomonas rubra DSM 5091]|uniref:phosphoglycolate phosphatase n=1 Tax=Malonomonas rubra DSM 5091 TaxID=1122189 RepID=A0A1M6EZR9_MALRU|nr:HAD-IA family hydrolase [Malonomonas rubra]SHI90905.1 phosphoglycolate phosphatase [Malonomonas rubra DSM 5091]
MNGMDYKYLLFDLDGTLVDSVADLTLSLNLLAKELGYQQLKPDRVRDMIGDGATKLIKRAYGEENYKREYLFRFLEIYAEHLLDHTDCYPGIRELLVRYPAEQLAVVTNKPYQLTIELLAGLNILDKFKVVIGGDSFSEKKPHPLPLQEALKALGAKAKEAVMIGDHHTDLNSGRAAGTAICFCSYGLGNTGGVEPDFLAKNSEELLQLFPG